jgi:hypothetical protein
MTFSLDALTGEGEITKPQERKGDRQTITVKAGRHVKQKR